MCHFAVITGNTPDIKSQQKGNKDAWNDDITKAEHCKVVCRESLLDQILRKHHYSTSICILNYCWAVLMVHTMTNHLSICRALSSYNISNMLAASVQCEQVHLSQTSEVVSAGSHKPSGNEFKPISQPRRMYMGQMC